jgi:hypothetical protein
MVAPERQGKVMRVAMEAQILQAVVVVAVLVRLEPQEIIAPET